MKIYVGIDVSKELLEIHQSNKSVSYSRVNTKSSIERLAKSFKKTNVSLIVMEASGGYEKLLVQILQSEQLKVSVQHPSRVRQFAGSMGIKAKTDRIDAKVLCDFAEKLTPALTKTRTKNENRLEALVSRREQLVEMRTREKSHRAEPFLDKDALASVSRHIKHLDAEIRKIEKQLKLLISKDEEFASRSELLTGVKGVGNIFVAVLLSNLPELGQLNRKEIAALTGVAPYDNSSGARIGKRSIRGGRERVRRVLYMATLAATRSNPTIKATFLRLRSRGKEPKVALTACMRKLITTLNAMVRDGAEWNEQRFSLPLEKI